MNPAFSFKTIEYDEVTSTNDLIKQAITDGMPEGTVVVARAQTAGYGRRGNRWASPPGGLYMSVLLRPNIEIERLQSLSLVAAMAVRRSVASFLPEENRDIVQIKWPNDVVIMVEDGKDAVFNKICGISLEQKSGAVCVGIGVNVHAPSHDNVIHQIKPGRNKVVYIEDYAADKNIGIDEVREELLNRFAMLYTQWLAHGFEPLRSEFMEHFALKGFKIRIDESKSLKPVRCEVRGITDEGHLIVLPEGSADLREIAAGTVTIVS